MPPPAGPPYAGPAVPVKFARHLAAVLLTVAAVAALGVAWAHGSEASWLAGSARGPGPIHLAQLAKAHDQGRLALSRPGGPGLSLSNSRDLVRTAVIEAVIMAVVVAVSALRRQRRRHRRARQAAASPAVSRG